MLPYYPKGHHAHHFSQKHAARLEKTFVKNRETKFKTVIRIRLRSDPYPYQSCRYNSGSKKSAKIMGNSQQIDKNYQNIIFLKIEITLLLNAHQ